MLLGRLLKILLPEYRTPFCTQLRLRAGKYRWFLFLVSKPCTYALMRKSYRFSITNNIKDKMYWLGTGRILSFFKQVPARTLWFHSSHYPDYSFLLFKYLMCMCWIFLKNYSVLKNWLEVCKVYHAQNISIQSVS